MRDSHWVILNSTFIASGCSVAVGEAEQQPQMQQEVMINWLTASTKSISDHMLNDFLPAF